MKPMLPRLHQPSSLHLLQPAFFEEAEDSLRKMERLLLALEPAEPGDADDEAVNSIFRCAHSVKGGAGAWRRCVRRARCA
jgi:chemotaxis protein histidine kinase CheA